MWWSHEEAVKRFADLADVRPEQVDEILLQARRAGLPEAEAVRLWQLYGTGVAAAEV